MTVNDLEHIIRAVGAIAQVDDLIIVGSQSILGQFPGISELTIGTPESLLDSQAVLLQSMEADVLIPESEEKTEIIEGTIGELSTFHTTFGYYAQGVSEATCTLPEGWKTRLVTICNENTRGVSGHCLEIHDLIISKLYAGREKDVTFFHAAAHMGLLTMATLLERLNRTPMSDNKRQFIENLIKRGLT